MPAAARAGLRPPGLSSGWPMPRFQAAFGMVSPANSHGVHETSRQNTTLTISERANNFMDLSCIKKNVILHGCDGNTSSKSKARDITTEGTELRGGKSQRNTRFTLVLTLCIPFPLP